MGHIGLSRRIMLISVVVMYVNKYLRITEEDGSSGRYVSVCIILSTFKENRLSRQQHCLVHNVFYQA
jgi:hypothetical protein